MESSDQEITAAAKRLASMGETLLIGVEGMQTVYGHAQLGSWNGTIQWFRTLGEAVKAAEEGG
jgi:hypothetical protein